MNCTNENVGQHKKVGFEVEPKSVSNMLTSDDHKTCKISQGHEFQEIKPSTNQVTFSYSVNWEKSETRWASRWDMYLEVKELLFYDFRVLINPRRKPVGPGKVLDLFGLCGPWTLLLTGKTYMSERKREMSIFIGFLFSILL